MNVREVMLRENAPSVLSRRQLYCWTKYCVGRFRGDHFRYGAVKPPDSRYRWFPAAIGREAILIACPKSFPTPEKAVAWLRNQGQVGRKTKRPSRRAQTERGS